MPDTTYFMKVDKVSGPVGVAPYTGWFQLVYYSPGPETPSVVGSVGAEGSSSPGNKENYEATLLKMVDRGSPLIAQLSSSGQRTTIIIAMVYSDAGILREKWRTTYKDALITNYKTGNAAASNIPTESLQLEALEMTLESPTGSQTSPTVPPNRSQPESLADWFTRVMPFPSSSHN
jgi:type VI protein secretion system component Hcp